MLVSSQISYADCIRFDSRHPNSPPSFDGPGSFGELQDTVTLDCLKYVGSMTKDGKEVVLIRDDQGKIHQLAVGSYMGENTGAIEKIDDQTIYIKQVIKRGDDFATVTVKFPKR